MGEDSPPVQAPMIRVQIKFYADLRRYRPELQIGETFPCSLPEETTVESLLSKVLGLPSEEVAIVLVNGVQRDGGHHLQEGDQVALWSPIAGG